MYIFVRRYSERDVGKRCAYGGEIVMAFADRDVAADCDNTFDQRLTGSHGLPQGECRGYVVDYDTYGSRKRS